MPLDGPVPVSDKHQSVLRFAESRRSQVSQFWHPRWDELAQFFHPDREGFQTENQEGDERRDDVYGSVSELAARSLASHLATALRPPGRTWFKAKARNEALNMMPEVRMWCDAVSRITYSALYDPRTQFETQCAHADRDLLVFGTACLQVGWNKTKGHLTFRTHHLKNVVLAADAAGTHDMAFIFWPLSLRQVTQMFPEDKWPESVKEKLRQSDNPNLEEKIEILHACLPNDDYMRFGYKAGRFPYSSMWISVKDKSLIDEGGYYEFPYVTPRWETATGEVYGRSPAMVALRDARLHDAMTRSFIESSETALAPPLQGVAQMIRGGIDLRSRGLTLYDPTGFPPGTRAIEPVQLGSQPEKSYEFLLKLEERLNAAFFRDVLELPRYDAGEKMTAAETNARLDQYLRQAAPVLTRLEAPYSAGTINRVFSVLAREHRYPEAPEALQGQDIEFDFESPMKAARDKAEALKIMEGLGMIAQMAAGLGPQKQAEVIDNIDADVTTRLLAYRADLPEQILVPLEKMIQGRMERAKQAKMMQMAEMAKTAGPAMAQMLQATGKARETGLIDTSNPLQIPAQPGSDMDPSAMIEDAAYEVMP